MTRKFSWRGPALILLLVTLAAPAAMAESSLHFDGVDDHVTMGAAPGLGLASFTLECRFRWDGGCACGVV